MPTARSPRQPAAPAWARATDAELLDLRFKDLKLSMRGSWIEPLVLRLHQEMRARGIRFRPHVWYSNEWFSPDGVPGIAIPFYLAHPRLLALERRQMVEAEGGTRDEALRILRHEAGHAVDTAWRLRRSSGWRGTFGAASAPYPDVYVPNPRSDAFVQHLDGWYAQSHPVEDFAETFAVWLQPRGGWRTRYAGWKAMAKLEYVDRTMRTLGSTTPPVRTRRQVDPLGRLDLTLGKHYARRRSHYGLDGQHVVDADLRRVFGADEGIRAAEAAATFLQREAPDLRRRVAAWTGMHPYTVQQYLREMTSRARLLRLKRRRALRKVRLESAILLTVQVMAASRGRGHRVAL
ncbi:MAG: putative zinc-binding metallopeptidase [Planctomycetota bacterium]|nr:putative zinc-binding metallopeptidase [Planctomycetota bacterium]MCB9825510.1 putative zinc-binding metallopeptidase [Planctomycetota bacterium]MCB9900604.1 putative zinc-binding metallopeptidase [Planctomycetota bacterium]